MRGWKEVVVMLQREKETVRDTIIDEMADNYAKQEGQLW